VDETIAAVRAVRADGARSVSLVGASLGGMVAVRVAARAPRGLDAVVTPSAERTARSLGDTLPYARRVHLPSLYLGTTDDGWTRFAAETRALHRATPARINRIFVLEGDEHGVDLLSSRHGARVRPLVARFVREHR
jgi:pimeloyl-ACP methyl ester carboxylesterase